MNTQDIVNIIKFHGLIKGSRRVLNEIVENELFDLLMDVTQKNQL